MRTAITIGFIHGGESSKLLHGPEVPIADQISAFKELPAHKGPHKDFEKIEVWESGTGVVKSCKYVTPEAHAAMLKEHARQKDEFEKAQAAREKRSVAQAEPPESSEPEKDTDFKGKKSKSAKAD